MMAPPLAGAGIIVRATRWKHPLPPPLTSRLGVLRPQRPRQLHPARTLGHIALVPSAHLGQMAQQGTLETLGQHRHTVAVTLSAPHPDLVRGEIEVLRPQPQRLEQPHPAAIQQPRDQSEEHTSELQSLAYLVCRLLLEKKKKKTTNNKKTHITH